MSSTPNTPEPADRRRRADGDASDDPSEVHPDVASAVVAAMVVAAGATSGPAGAPPPSGGSVRVVPEHGFVFDGETPRRGRHRRSLAAGAVIAAIVLASGGVLGVRASSADPGADLRTATVATRSVAQTIDAVAVVEPVSQASVAFPVAGTVASTSVVPGDAVTTGQVLATLDGATLQASINQAQATLAGAQLALQQALDGETVTGGAAGGSATMPAASGSSTSATAGTGSTGVATSEDTAPTTGSSATNDEIVAAQQAVVDAQAAVDAGLVRVEQALANADQVCAAIGASTSSTAGPTEPAATPGSSAPTSAAAPTTTVTILRSSAATPDTAAIDGCQRALSQVLSAQQELAAQQVVVDQAVQTLTGLLPAEDAAAGSGAATTSGATSSGSTASATTGTTTNVATAAELVAYQKAVDAAAVEVAVAEQALEQATIVSPIDGTVVSSGLAVGDDVTAGSSTATIVIAGGAGYELTTTVSVTDLPALEVGQAVTIRPDSTSSELAGQVVAIGVVPSADSTTSYPVTIGVIGDATALRNGSTASVSIVTDETTDATAVPASAVTVEDDRATVTVVDGEGRTSDVSVEVGATGSSWMAVTSGLEVGQTVVLADLDEPLPGAATDGSAATTTGGRSGVPGGFSGGPPAGLGARPGG